LLVAALAGPSLAGGKFDARNADMVDGKHAVGSGASVSERKGKVVATSSKTGRLPNSIIGRARNADKLDGLDSAAFSPAVHQHDAGDITGDIDAETLDGFESSAFVQRTDTPQIAVHQSWYDWQPAQAVTLGFDTKEVSVSKGSTGDGSFFMVPTMPGTLYGKDLSLDKVEFCYDATDAGVTLSAISFRKIVNTDGAPLDNTAIPPDTEDRDDAACRSYTPTSAVTLDEATHLSLEFIVNWSTMNTPFYIGRTTVFVTPID
jgi:hypothetical protein